MRAVVPLVLAMVGCLGEVGTVGETEPEAPSRPQEGGGSGRTPGPMPPPGPGPVAAGCGAPDPGPSFLRKLTADEYDATVAALLGDEGRPGAAFPSEGRALGFDNNAETSSVSRLSIEQYMLAAQQLAARAAAPGRLERLLPCAAGIVPAAEDACARQLIEGWGKRAFRRPLDAAEKEALGQVFAAGRASGFARGIELVIRVALQSPQFLYRIEVGVPPARGERFGRPTQWETASRLSYLLWGSMPDDALLAAAEAGRLGTREEIAVQARRLIADRRSRKSVERFHRQWLELELVDDLDKDRALFPTFDPALAPLLRTETERFVDHVVWEADGRIETLFQAPYTFLDGRLAAYYGVKGPAGAAFERVAMDPGRRTGLLTQAGLLAAHAYPNQTSPIHRGKFVRVGLLCHSLPPPPDTVMVEPPRLDPKLTTRERFNQHATDPLCSGCHRLIDPIGLGFEQYDAAGLYRSAEAGRPIDASGEVVGTGIGRFDGVVDLSRKLSVSHELRACVLRQWFRFAYGRGEQSADACTLASLEASLVQSGNDLRELLVALTQTDAFLHRRPPEAP